MSSGYIRKTRQLALEIECPHCHEIQGVVNAGVHACCYCNRAFTVNIELYPLRADPVQAGQQELPFIVTDLMTEHVSDRHGPHTPFKCTSTGCGLWYERPNTFAACPFCRVP